jgi:hypothetical protein
VDVRRDVIRVGTGGLFGLELEDVVGEEVGASFGADVVVEVAQELEDLKGCTAVGALLEWGLEALGSGVVFDRDGVSASEKGGVDKVAEFAW